MPDSDKGMTCLPTAGVWLMAPILFRTILHHFDHERRIYASGPCNNSVSVDEETFKDRYHSHVHIVSN